MALTSKDYVTPLNETVLRPSPVVFLLKMVGAST